MKIPPRLSVITALVFFTCCTADSTHYSDNQPEVQHLQVTFPDSHKMRPDWPKQNSLVVMIQSDPVSLHPCSPSTSSSIAIQNLIQQYLVVVDQQQPRLVPELVKSLPDVSKDGLEYTYELLKEATWDDGSPITAADVIFTLKANKCPLIPNATVRSYVENLKTVISDSLNPKKFTMIMKTPYVSNISMAANFPILCSRYFDPQKVLSHYTFEQLDDPVFNPGKDITDWSVGFNDGKYGTDPSFFYGAGAYKVISWDHGATIILARKDNHWTQRLASKSIYQNSFPARIIFKVVKDENAQMLEFKSQVLDATSILTTKALLELEKDSSFNRNYNSAFIENYGANYIALNTRPDGISHKKIFSDLNVRRAFAMLTPVDQIIKVVILGQAVRLPSMISPLKPEYNSDLKLIDFDLEQSKKLLEQAGWTDTDGDGIRDKIIDGERLPLQVEFSYFSQGNASKDIASMLTEAAAQGGVKIISKPMDMAALAQNAKNHDFDMLMLGWSTSALQEDYTQVWHTDSWANKGSNYSGFGNAASDALIDSIKHTLNDSLRHSMSRRFQKMVYDAQPYIFLYSTYRKIAIHRRWGNQIMTAEAPGLIFGNLKLIAPMGKVASLVSK